VVVDAEEAAGAPSDKFAGFQPPRSERERYDVVTGQLDAAASLLSEVRIAVVAGNEAQMPDRDAAVITTSTPTPADLTPA
jgi:hypothetical protein